MEFIFIAAALFLFCVLVFWLWADGKRRRRRSEISTAAPGKGGTECPLCDTNLPKGDLVHSKIFPGKEFDMMRIYGCPFCWHKHSKANRGQFFLKRRCPFCQQILPEKDEYVIAQVYNKPRKRLHVHVIGCTVCKPGRA